MVLAGLWDDPWSKDFPLLIPNAPCMEYLPTFALECGHFSPNVGKYSLHGASGNGQRLVFGLPGGIVEVFEIPKNGTWYRIFRNL